MTWFQQLQLLQHFEKVIPNHGIRFTVDEGTTESDFRQQLEEIESQFANEVDATVRAFSRTGRIPEFSKEAGYFLRRRVDFAIWMGLALCATDSGGNQVLPELNSRQIEKEDHVEWLLIWAWRSSGKANWIRQLVQELLLPRSKRNN